MARPGFSVIRVAVGLVDPGNRGGREGSSSTGSKPGPGRVSSPRHGVDQGTRHMPSPCGWPPRYPRYQPPEDGFGATGSTGAPGQEGTSRHARAYGSHAEAGDPRRVVGRYREHPAIIGYQVDNEARPAAATQQPTSSRRFVDWLRRRYATVDRLKRGVRAGLLGTPGCRDGVTCGVPEGKLQRSTEHWALAALPGPTGFNPSSAGGRPVS